MDAITPISDEAEKPSHAPYGKACMNCVKSKTRCAGGTDGEKCERFVFSGLKIIQARLSATISQHAQIFLKNSVDLSLTVSKDVVV